MSSSPSSAVRPHQRHWLALVERVGDGEESDDVLGVRRWRAPRDPSRKLAFHKPICRARRLKTVDGRTSFTFSYSSVVKVAAQTDIDGRTVRPGAARAHCQYIEREAAVAGLERALSRDIVVEQTADGRIAAAMSPAEHDHQHDHQEEIESDIETQRSRVIAKFAGIVTDLVQQDALTAGRADPFAAPDLRGLSRGDLGHGSRPAGLLVPDEGRGELSRGHDKMPGDVRLAGDTDRSVQQDRKGRLSRGRGARRTPAQHETYIERASALAVQPDGTRCLLTNIDADPAERLRFWSLVETEESNPSPDTMTFDISKAPEFWKRVAETDGCPVELKAAIEAEDPKARRKFTLSSGRAVRAFLARQPGWIGNRKKGEGETREAYNQSRNPLASFSDGRGGRTQYRLIGELPHELSFNGKLSVVRSLTQELEEKGLPFVLAMHAPDHANDEKNWHFHLDIYDRPCRRITAADIAWARREGYDIASLSVGDWDFAATTFRSNRRDRPTRPFRREKVNDLRKNGAIEAWRYRLAQLSNFALAAEGQSRRLDPRTYELMGIKAEPGEHLGTNASAAEGKGEVTSIGVANEEKQWRAIVLELAERFERETASVRQAADARRKRLDASDLGAWRRADVARRIDELELALLRVADCDHLAAEVHETTARMCSRPAYVQRVNTRWIEADDSGERVMSDRERKQREDLRAAATAYLDGIKPLVDQGAGLIAASHGEAADLRRRADVIDRQIDDLLRQGGSRSAAPVPTPVVSAPTAAPAARVTISAEADVPMPTAPVPIIVSPTVLHPPTAPARPAGTPAPPPPRPPRVGGFAALLRHPSSPHISRSPRSSPPRDDGAVARERAAPAMPSGTERPTRPDAGRISQETARNAGARVSDSPKGHIRDADRPPLTRPLHTQPTPAPALPEAGIVSPPASSGVSGGAVPPSPAPGSADGSRHDLQGPPGAADAPVPAGRSDEPQSINEQPDVQEGRSVEPVDRKEPPAATTSPGDAAVDGSEGRPQQPAPRSNISKIVEDEKVRVRLDRNGLVDLGLLAAQGFALPEDQRANPRLVGRAKAQARYAAERIAAFVAKAPFYVEKHEGRYRLASRAEFLMVETLRDHDGPEIQAILRSAAMRRRATATMPAPPAATGPTDAATAVPSATHISILRPDEEMIAEARRYREAKEKEAAAAAASAEARPGSRLIGGEGRSGPARGSKDVDGDAARAARIARDIDRFGR